MGIAVSIHFSGGLSLHGPFTNWQGGNISIHYYVSRIARVDGKLAFDMIYGFATWFLMTAEKGKENFRHYWNYFLFVTAGRRDFRGYSLRENLDRRHSPHRRYSPGREKRGWHAFHGYSHSRSPIPRSERRQRKKHHLDGQSDVSGSVRNADSAEDLLKEGKVSSHDDKNIIEEQLKQAQLDIDMLDDHKNQLEMALEEKGQEVDGLTGRIQELEIQLHKGQEDCERMTSKIKKFVKAYDRYSRAQEELKRTQARLQRLGDQLGSDISRPGTNEEDSSVNIVSDGETHCNNHMSPKNELEGHIPPSKKRLGDSHGPSDEAKPVTRKREVPCVRTTKLGKLTQWNGSLQSENKSKESDAASKVLIGKNVYVPLANEIKRIRGKSDAYNVASSDKVKGSELVHFLPSTSMAAHAVDDLVEALDQEEKLQTANDACAVDLTEYKSKEKLETRDATTEVFDNVIIDDRVSLLCLPPPPPVSQNAYKQYEGEDEDVDVEDLDVDVGDADVNIEVKIEQM